MSLRSMISGVGSPITIPAPEKILNSAGIEIPNPDFGKLIPNPASLFKNPAESALKEMSTATDGMKVIASSMVTVDPAFNIDAVVSGMSETSAGITSQLTTKISAISTELPLALAAQKQENITQTVDAILTKNASNVVDPIQTAFPAPVTPGGTVPCPGNHVADVMAPVTKANAEVAKAVTETAKKFDLNAATAPLYAAINSIPGLSSSPITDGAGLLKALGSIPASLSGAVSSAISGVMSSNPGIVTNLKASFADVYTPAIPDPSNPLGPPLQAAKGAVADLGSSFNKMIEDSTAAVAKSFAVVTGANTVKLINSTNPCVAEVMAAVVNTEAVDNNAIVLSEAVKNRVIDAPGQAVIEQVNVPAPLDPVTPFKPKVTTTDLIEPAAPKRPECVPYSKSEMSVLATKVKVEEQAFSGLKAAQADELKKIQDWMKSVNYDGKKLAANSTKENPLGSSSDTEALNEWKPVYVEYLFRRDNFNNNVLPAYNAAVKKINEIRDEYQARNIYGKNPYTFAISRGIAWPEDKQTVWLDTTK